MMLPAPQRAGFSDRAVHAKEGVFAYSLRHEFKASLGKTPALAAPMEGAAGHLNRPGKLMSMTTIRWKARKCAPVICAVALTFTFSGCAPVTQVSPPAPVTSARDTRELNTATPAELEQIPGFAPFILQKTLFERSLSPFQGCDDLEKRVVGLSRLSLGRMSYRGLRVNGQACGVKWRAQ